MALAIDVFVTICLSLALISTVGFLTVRAGTRSMEFWTNPPLLVAITSLVSVIVMFAVYCIVQSLLLRPLRGMLEAVSELGHGNFNVRVEVGDGVRLREIDEFAENFNVAARELSGVWAMRSDFIDDFSHEFKTPIVSISGFADLLRSDDLTDEERKEYAQIIYDESRRLSMMANDILLLRQAESKQVLTDTEPV